MHIHPSYAFQELIYALSTSSSPNICIIIAQLRSQDFIGTINAVCEMCVGNFLEE